MLTPKQAQLLRYLTACQEDGTGVSPTFDQMAAVMGLKSKSGIYRLLSSLQERGFIKRRHGIARSIVVLFRPGEVPGSEVSLDDLRSVVGKLCEREGFATTCAALIAMAQEIVPSPEAQ